MKGRKVLLIGGAVGSRKRLGPRPHPAGSTHRPRTFFWPLVQAGPEEGLLQNQSWGFWTRFAQAGGGAAVLMCVQKGLEFQLWEPPACHCIL